MAALFRNFKKDALVILKASLFYNFAVGLFAPFYAIYVRQIGGSILDAGLAYAFFNIAMGLLVLTFCRTGFYLRHTRSIIVIGYFLDVFGSLGYIFVVNPTQLFLVQIFLGLSLGLSAPAWDTLYSSDLSKEKANLQWTVWTGGVSLAIGAGALIGGLVVTFFSFKTLFLSIATVNLISGIISWKIVKDKT